MSSLKDRLSAHNEGLPKSAEKSLHDRVEDGTFGFPAGTAAPAEIQNKMVERAAELRMEYEALTSSFMQRIFNRGHVEKARLRAERAAEAAYGKNKDDDGRDM